MPVFANILENDILISLKARTNQKQQNRWPLSDIKSFYVNLAVIIRWRYLYTLYSFSFFTALVTWSPPRSTVSQITSINILNIILIYYRVNSCQSPEVLTVYYRVDNCSWNNNTANTSFSIFRRKTLEDKWFYFYKWALTTIRLVVSFSA